MPVLFGGKTKTVKEFDKQSVFPPAPLPYRVKLLSQALFRYFQNTLDPFGLTPFQWGVLTCLWRKDGLPTSTIGEWLEQLAGTLTGVLDTMESRGLVRRERDPDDRRVWRVWLTKEGKEMEAKLVPVVLQTMRRVFANFSARDYDELSRLVDRLYEDVAKLG
jgi:DNA-binding MarR family transcriptional regulator